MNMSVFYFNRFYANYKKKLLDKVFIFDIEGKPAFLRKALLVHNVDFTLPVDWIANQQTSLTQKKQP